MTLSVASIVGVTTWPTKRRRPLKLFRHGTNPVGTDGPDPISSSGSRNCQKWPELSGIVKTTPIYNLQETMHGPPWRRYYLPQILHYPCRRYSRRRGKGVQSRLYVCLFVRALKGKHDTHILYSSRSACNDQEVKRSKIKVTRLRKTSRSHGCWWRIQQRPCAAAAVWVCMSTRLPMFSSLFLHWNATLLSAGIKEWADKTFRQLFLCGVCGVWKKFPRLTISTNLWDLMLTFTMKRRKTLAK